MISNGANTTKRDFLYMHGYSQPSSGGGERLQSRIPGVLLEWSRPKELLLYLDTPYICQRAPAAGGVIRGHNPRLSS